MRSQVGLIASLYAFALAGAEEWAPSHDLRGDSVPMPDERQLQFLDEELNQVSTVQGMQAVIV